MWHLQEMYEEYRNRGVVVLGLNCSDDLDIALEFLEENEATFPNVLTDSADVRATCFDDYQTLSGMSAVPLSYVIDRNGRIAASWYGKHSEDRVRKVLANLRLTEEEPGEPEEPEEPARAEPPAEPADRPILDPAKRMRDARKRSARWLADLRHKDSAELRAQALQRIGESFTSSDSTTLLTGLLTARSMGDADFERKKMRSLILPHANSKDRDIRLAALQALVAVRPMASDLERWVKEAPGLTRDDHPEGVAKILVMLSEGKLTGRAADGVLALLRDGTRIKRAFVMRGLAEAEVFEPRLVDRLTEIASAAEPSNYDCGYFMHFLVPRIRPLPDAVVDLVVERGHVGGYPHERLERMKGGLTEEQRRRVAAAVMVRAETAKHESHRGSYASALVWLAGSEQVERLEKLAAAEDQPDYVRKYAKEAAKAARERR